MALGQHRIIEVGETPYAHEREGIAFVTNELPNNDPYLAWPLAELLDPSTGRLYELDLLVLGHSALYLLELKGGPGTYQGDSVDWIRDVPGERAHPMDCPYRLVNHKAKVLAGLLQRKLGRRTPWITPLIFLSNADAKEELRADGRTGVVTRATVKRALTHHDFPNRDPGWRGQPIPQPVMRDLAAALRECGIRPRKGKLQVGDHDLGEILQEGDAYQDRVAVHRRIATIHHRARIYLVPQQTSVERRQALRRAADREVHLLHELREHAGILRLAEYFDDAPLGPTVMLDAFEDGVPLDTFVRLHQKELSFSDRLAIIEQVARALAFCHRKEILHGGLNPESILVRRRGNVLETRLFNFQLASAEGRVQGTAHVSAWSGQPALVYQAPEVREDPASRRRESDIFSLGAVAYFVLTGQPPAADVRALDARLAAQRGLDPRAVNDAISAGVGEVIANATNVSWTQRYDDANEWIDLLLEYATSPEPTSRPEYADPLAAKKDDRLSADLVVLGTLGQGASARVLKVRRDSDGGEYALKVSLSPEHDERIRAEGRALAQFRHPRIVERIADLELGGRPCVLLAIAGTMTLQQRIQREGPVPLDYAQRWGNDLLSAVEYLEQEEITHRDIKPANLGIGSSGRKKNHLALFDFSLVLAEKSALDVGTAAYRDPFLGKRGAWDTAADLYSAALTLHEMIAGVRPTYSGAAIDPESKLVLAAERFDPSIRDRLVRFFERALAREVTQRFGSAADTSRAWSDCFREAPAQGVSEGPAVTPEAEPRQLTDDEIRAIGPDAPLETLPLSVRAKNALDRAGVARARDLAKLPANRLSAIRGIGRDVGKEVHEFRTRWTALSATSDLPVVPFFPGYAGEDHALGMTALPAATTAYLIDAGLRSLCVLASASEELIATLAARHGFDVAPIRAALDHEHKTAEERDHPTTLEGFVAAIFPRKAKKKKAPEAVCILFGLEPAANGAKLPIGASADDAARAHGTTTANIYLGLGRARELWSTVPATADIVALAVAIVSEASGAIALTDAADRLLLRLPHDRNRAPEELRTEAAALLRAAREVDREALDYLRLGARAWLCASQAHASAVRGLAKVADELAGRTPLASAPETQDALLREVKDTPFAALAIERLVALAAAASATAACSTRLEMYPRGMSVARAVELTASVLTGKPTPEEVQKRVADRYPEAAALPERPALDTLLEPYGLRWTGSVYERPNEAAQTRHSTRLPTATTHLPLATDPSTPEEQDFDERLSYTIEKQQFRLVLVRADLASRAIARLAERLNVTPLRVDRLLLEAMESRADADHVERDALHDTHLHGATGRDWGQLVGLADDALTAVLAKILPASKPLVLTHLGLIERYGLQRFFDAIAEASRRDDCQAIFLVVPAHDEAGLPALGGLTIPGLLPAQRIWASRDWIRKQTIPAAATA